MFSKSFELYQLSMHNFPCEIFLIFPYCVKEDSMHFGLEIKHSLDPKNTQEKSAILTEIFKIIQIFMNTFLCQTFPKLFFYILPKLPTTRLI